MSACSVLFSAVFPRSSASANRIPIRAAAAAPAVVERSVILCTGDTFWVDEAWISSQDAPRPKSSGLLTETLQSYEEELIEAALAESNEKVAGPNGAAAKLGIPRSTLDLKIKQLNIKKHDIR
jgi:formate hydrogenlyase transcriptional activator